MGLPSGQSLTNVKIFTIFADFFVHNAVHHMDRWRHLRELVWHMDSHKERLVGASQHKWNPVVNTCGIGGGSLRVGEELEELTDLLLANPLQWVHAHHLLLRVLLHHARASLSSKVVSRIHLRAGVAHTHRLLHANLLLSRHHALHLVLREPWLLLHTIHAWLLVEATSHGALTHDISLWIISCSILLLHFNIIVINLLG